MTNWRMRSNICAAFCAALLWGQQAVAQQAPARAGTAGEAAPANGAAPAPESYSIKPIAAHVDVSDAMRVNANADRDDWLLYGRTYDNQRFSPLTGINTANVGRLRPVALLQTGVMNSFENTPIVVDGIMYVETAYNHVQAYDAVNGQALWTYTPKLEYSDLCCGPQSRGIAIGYGKVFASQLDGHVVALDARTGKLLWKTDNADALPAPAHFYSFTMAPQVYDGMILVGNAGAEWPTRGFMEALDANTGKRIWRFNTTAAPGEPGGDSWSGDSWKFGGGSVWDTAAIDTKNGLMFFATGNPNPDLDGSNRKGANAYTDSIVALNIKTGKIAWWYQQVAHDVWDYDACAPVVLFDTVDETGKTVPAAAEAGKVGNVFIVNRLTGKLIRKSDPIVPIGPTMFRVPDQTPTLYYPGNKGGAMWSPPAFSPVTHRFYTMGVNEGHIFVMKPGPEYVPDTPITGQFAGGTMATDLKTFDPTGTFSAVDVNTGKIAWQYKSDHPMYGGALATASNLVFTGEMNGNFDAFDAVSGKLLWHYNLGMGVCTPPITYRVKGVQYVAVGASGCHGGEPIMQNMGRPPFGDTLAIFALAG